MDNNATYSVENILAMLADSSFDKMKGKLEYFLNGYHASYEEERLKENILFELSLILERNRFTQL